MKSLTLLLALFAASTFAADTPAEIAADYREKAAAALARVNSTLETATVPLVAALVKSGDTAGADLLKEQLKAKIAGEPVAMPQPTAAALFKSYDAARTKALEPAQKAAVKRIDAVLASSEGKKLDVVSELGKVRAEIEAGTVEAITPMAIPAEWTYHRTKTTPAEAKVWLNPDGSFLMEDGNEKKGGKWKPGKAPNTLTINYAVNRSVWKVSIDGDLATVERPDINETRYFRVKK